MASNIKKLGDLSPSEIPNQPNKRFGIVVSEYYEEITSKLLEGAIETLIQHQVNKENIFVQYVPGAYEMPLGCLQLNTEVDVDAIIAIGCVVRGETDHDKYINAAVANGLMDLNLKYNKPFIFGLLTPNTYQQAVDRAGGKHGNKGKECAIAALKMV